MTSFELNDPLFPLVFTAMKKLESFLSKNQSKILIAAILLSSFAISIRSSDEGVILVFKNYPVIIFLMVVVSSILIVLYIQIDKKRIANLSDQIKNKAGSDGDNIDSLILDLTLRQKEVYDLIIAGKSNKEITSELYIEQSTLKTHINQIYKKLNISSRRELRSKNKVN